MDKKRNLRIFFILLVLAALLSLLTLQGRAGTTSLKASFIDVGQGDSILLSDGNGFDVLIDGGKPDAGPTVVAYLRGQGVDDIDVMVNTHPDSDHVGGLIDVLALADIPVLAVVYNGYPGDTTTWDTFATAVADEGLVMTPAQFPGTFNWGDMTAQVLNPAYGLTNPETNNASVVLLVSHGSVSFLLTGDIDATQEATVMARSTPVAADILKVAHHGSSYSSSAAFLAAVAPTDAIISVGVNSYGHPGADTLSRLLAAGAAVWRTDQAGTITVFSNGSTYMIEGEFYFVYLPLLLQQSSATPPPVSDLQITALNGTTTPESVVIENKGAAAQDLTGWTLFSVEGSQVFSFPAGFVLAAGGSVTVSSGSGAVDNPPSVLRWTTASIWNNSGDKAELRNAASVVVSSACYSAGCP
jgi:competence protein ComEC